MTSHGVIVIVEDDPAIDELLRLYLSREGFAVRSASTGTTGLELVRTVDPRLVILDVGLGEEPDGFEVCRRLRQEPDSAGVPVLLLTARHDEVDRVVGLELGADDYVTKPFSPRELMARVKAILRRVDGGAGKPTVLALGDVEVDLGRREVTVGATPVALTTRELDLFVHLLRSRGLVLTRRQLLDAVWGPGWVGDERTVDVHVGQLRKKLGAGLPLATVWGYGYRLG